MGRPPLGRAKKSRTIGVHVTQDQYDLIAKQGVPGVWARRVVLDALLTAITPDKPAQPPATRPTKTAKAQKPRATPAPEPPRGEPSLHRHKRERTGEKWVGGRDVGEWKCADPACGVTLGPLQ